jgi:hypothetical protein
MEGLLWHVVLVIVGWMAFFGGALLKTINLYWALPLLVIARVLL